MNRRRLNDAVHVLVNPHQTLIDVDGTKRLVHEDALLDQLATTYLDTRHGGSSGGSKASAPIDTTCLDLANDIRAEVMGLAKADGLRIAGTTAQLIQAWADATSNENAHHAAENWVFQIRSVFEPVKVHHVNAPCPACGQKKLQAYALGEGSYAECDCGARWEANQLHDLAAQISEAA